MTGARLASDLSGTFLAAYPGLRRVPRCRHSSGTSLHSTVLEKGGGERWRDRVEEKVVKKRWKKEVR